MTEPATTSTLLIGRDPAERTVSVDDVLAVARGHARLVLDASGRERIARSHRVLEKVIANGGDVYGATTGVGASVTNAIPAALRDDLPHNLLRFHGCGTGRILDEEEAAAVLAVRVVSLAAGHSAVRPELVERLCEMANLRLLPRIPAEGSVGASGDLTPLSYVAAALIGEREVTLAGRVRSAADALAEVGLVPLSLGPRESLAIMNGTAVMTALGCIAWDRARRLARMATALTAAVSDVTHGNPEHFDARVFAWKPHPGSEQCAQWLREDLSLAAPGREVARLQDRYSLRCAPQVIGVLLDVLETTRATLEIELNGVDDNPLFDPDRGEVVHAGNFYGGHVAQAMDSLKACVASVCDLIDRQLVLLCDPATSAGLPENLVAIEGDQPYAAHVHHGFKAMQITASALTAEAQKLTMPAAAFSRSTESHNQDKVSMGTIAARDCLRIVELCETVGAVLALAACQAVDLRGPARCCARSRQLHAEVRKHVPSLDADRRQDHDIDTVLGLLRAGTLPIGETHEP